MKALLKNVVICSNRHHQGPDHLQLILLNWDNKSVLALNKKLKVIWKFQFFI